MEFEDGEKTLYAILSHKSGGDADALLEKIGHVRLALLKRAGSNTYQQQIITAAVKDVTRYVDEGKPPGDHRRQNLYAALSRLRNLANFDNPEQKSNYRQGQL